MPAQDICMYPASKVSATLSRTNQFTPVFACRLNSKVPLKSGGPMLVADTPAPKSAKGTQRVPVARLYRKWGVSPTSDSVEGENCAPLNNSPRISQLPRYQCSFPTTSPNMLPYDKLIKARLWFCWPPNFCMQAAATT